MKPTTPGTAPAFLTVKELADRWKLSTRSVWRLIADGRLRVHRIGRLVRIALADIVLFEATSRPAV
jgi:excisionase family DNA binding protein